MASTGATLAQRHEVERVELLMEVLATADTLREFACHVRAQTRRIEAALYQGKFDLAGVIAAQLEWECDRPEHQAEAGKQAAYAALGGTP